MLRCYRALDDLCGVLLTHVLNLDRQQGTELQALFQCLVGLIGVYMDLYDVIIFDDNERVANLAQQRTHTTNIARLILALCDKLGAVGEGDIFICNCAEIRTGFWDMVSCNAV